MYDISIALGFETMIRFIYTAQESLVTDILDLELLFEVYRLADQVDMYLPYPYQYLSGIDVNDLIV
jgi:hypothetical protein